MGFSFDGGFGIFAVVAMLVGVVFWVLVIAALVLGVRWLIRQNSQDRLPPVPPVPPAPDPVAVLRERYARGEIDDEEFERRRKTLGG
jgi:putative membrane protein